MRRSISSVLWLMVACLLSCTYRPLRTNSLPVYGNPGPNKVQVTARGVYQHQGIYWLDRGTTLDQLIELAKPLSREYGVADRVVVVRGYEEPPLKWRFLISTQKEIGTGKSAKQFRLKDGDIVRTSSFTL